MIAVADVVTYASTILNDQEPGFEFTVWEEAFLEQAVEESIALIASVDASAFVKTELMTLAAGIAHPVPAEKRNNLRINAQICGATRRYNIDRVDSASIKDSTPSPSIPCGACTPRPMFGCGQVVSPCGDWDLRKWAWSEDQPDLLYTYPPVVTTGSIEISFTGETVTAGVAPLHERWLPAIVAYTLFRAYSKDNESQIHVARSTSNLNTFVALTGIKIPSSQAKQASGGE